MTGAQRGDPPSGTWGEALALGVMFPAAVVAGYLLGRVVAHWLGLGDWVPYAGGGLGALAAFVRLLRWAIRNG
ncbi:MAG: hypothetical protein ABI968_05585 [Acidobacteriota bacterium]